jgi:hypothetical protein
MYPQVRIWSSGKGIVLGRRFRIEMELESPDVAMIDSGSSNAYGVKDFRLYLDLVDVNAELDGRVMSGLRSGQVLGLRMTQSNCLPADVSASTQQQVIRFSVFKRSLKALLFFLRSSSDTSSKTASSLSKWFRNNLEQFQVRINDFEVPEAMVRTDKGAVEAYAELDKALGLYRNFASGSQLKKNYSDQLGNGYDLGFGVALDRYLDEGSVESGLDTRVRASPLEVLLNFSSSPSAGNIAIIPVYDAHLVVASGYVRVDD